MGGAGQLVGVGWQPMTSFDVVVIGSGAGGAPVAQRLAARGMKVLVVERGKRFTRQDFEDRDEIEWARRDRFVPSIHTDPHTRRSHDQQAAQPTTDGWISSILGGGTVHMSGYFLPWVVADAKQKSRLDAQREASHSAIDWAVPFADIARYYPIVAQEVGVAGAEGSTLSPLAEHPVAQRCDDVAKRLGIPVQRTPRAVLTEHRPDEDRQACSYRLVCGSYGCPNNARGSTLATYLRRAEKTGNVTVWTAAQALTIDKGTDGVVTGVQVKHLDTGEQQTVHAGRVVVACSAIESARLLLLSDINPGGQVGKNLWFSVYVDVNGWFNKQQHPDVMTGSPFIHRSFFPGGELPAARLKEHRLDRAGTLDVLWEHDNPIMRAERAATEGGLLWGKALKAAVHRRFTQGRMVLCEGFGECTPHAGSYVDLDPTARDHLGRPAARMTIAHHPRDVRVAQAMVGEATRILEELGCNEVHTRVALGETTFLQGGTCRISTSAKDGVIDPSGRVHGYQNLYVTDGGSLPSSGTAPGTMTILANALRIAEAMPQ
jgi:choline dehydrogenase-like flavoprotein